MKTHRWRDIRDAGGKITQKRLAEIDAAVAEEVRSFRELREALGITQTDPTKLANMTQSEVSKFETRDDHRIERMREMVEASAATRGYRGARRQASAGRLKGKHDD